jgi:hypothetical protein
MVLADFKTRSYEDGNRKARSVTDVIVDVVGDVTALFRNEVQLARTEFSEKMGRAAAGLGFVVGGAVLLIPALVILLEAAVAALVHGGVPPYWAALIVGGVVLAIGVAILAIGTSRLRPANLTPTKTIEQLQRDAEIAKRQGRQNVEHN